MSKQRIRHGEREFQSAVQFDGETLYMKFLFIRLDLD